MDSAGSDPLIAVIRAQGMRIHHQEEQNTSVCTSVRELLEQHEIFQALMGSMVCHINEQLHQLTVWLEGAEQPFLFWMDHKNPEYIRMAKRLNTRQARWALFSIISSYPCPTGVGSQSFKPEALSHLFGPSVLPSTSCRHSAWLELSFGGSGKGSNRPTPTLWFQMAHISHLTYHPRVCRTILSGNNSGGSPWKKRWEYVAACLVSAHLPDLCLEQDLPQITLWSSAALTRASPRLVGHLGTPPS